MESSNSKNYEKFSLAQTGRWVRQKLSTLPYRKAGSGEEESESSYAAPSTSIASGVPDGATSHAVRFHTSSISRPSTPKPSTAAIPVGSIPPSQTQTFATSIADAAMSPGGSSRTLPLPNPNRDVKQPANMRLWDQAIRSMAPKHADLINILQENLNGLESQDSLAENLAQLLMRKLDDRSKTHVGNSQSRLRKYSLRFARFVASTKDIGMGLARLDPHKIAPIVLGGVYTLVQTITNDNEDNSKAMLTTLEIIEMIAQWNHTEARQISMNKDPNLNKLYEILGRSIICLYQEIIILLARMLLYFDKNRWQKFIVTLSRAPLEWEEMKDRLKAHEKKCDRIKLRITTEKENKSRNSQILMWLSSYDVRGSYISVLERTGLDDRYSAQCQWLIDHQQFEHWCTPGNKSILWLQGTIGTGKTTLMVRAIRELKDSIMIKSGAMQLAIFFFRKSSGTSSSALGVEDCLRSLVRQLSWNTDTEEVDSSAEQMFEDCENQRSGDTSLSLGECTRLLSGVISQRETYIMIDGVDECSDKGCQKLVCELNNLYLQAGSAKPLHLMLCGRNDVPVWDFFHSYLTIETGKAYSKGDEEFYIDSEVNAICQNKPASLFTMSAMDFPSQLKRILKEKAGGLFRWVEIQISVFKETVFRVENEIEEELRRVMTHSTDDELNDEYARLLDLLSKYEGTRKVALRMLKLLACSFTPIGADHLAEAVNASENGPKRSIYKPEDIQRILMGFISIQNSEHSSPAIQLAHSSVLEFFMDRERSKVDFSTSDQHSEAARLCFLGISYGMHSCEKSSLNSRSFRLEEMSLDVVPSFFAYSMLAWPLHCNRAFLENNNGPLAKITKDFLLSDNFQFWNEQANHDNVERIALGPGFRFDVKELLCRIPFARPGFIIAAIYCQELLEDPEMQKLINLHDVNQHNTTVFKYILQYSPRWMIKRLAELYPQQVKSFREVENFRVLYLNIAVKRGLSDIVESLLDTVNMNTFQSSSELYLVIECLIYPEPAEADSKTYPGLPLLHGFLYPPRWDSGRAKGLLQTVQVLLEKGAYIFEVEDEDCTFMHDAARRSMSELLRIFVEFAIQLERHGVHGSVQRLLRIRNDCGRTPADYAKGADVKYLEDRLREAVIRDKRVMWDFDSPEIAEIHTGRLDLQVFMKYLSMDDYDAKRNMQADASIFLQAERQYSNWLFRRRRSLDKEFRSQMLKVFGAQ